MYKLIVLLILIITDVPSLKAQSKLLESVKRNPTEAIEICKKFRELNEKGISSSSKEVIQSIGIERNLNYSDAEVLTIYIRHFHCSNVF